MTDLNPGTPATAKAIHELWHTLCLLIMRKFKHNHIVLTYEEFAEIVPGSLAIVMEDKGDGFHLNIVTMAEAVVMSEEYAKKVKEAGGAIPKMD